MLKTYFKTAWRNLLKNKFHSSVNIIGLVIGFTIGLVVLMMVYSQLGFDSFHQNRKRLYQVYSEFYNKDKTDISNVFGFPAASVYKTEAPAIEKSSRFLFGGSNAWIGEKEIELHVTLVDEDFLSMFSFPVVKGNRQNPLHSLADIVLTENAAKKLFGNEDAVGKTIRSSAGGEMHDLQVSAVVKNFPENSSLKFDALARTELRTDFAKDKENWNNQHHPVYVMLKKGMSGEQAERELRIANKKHLADWYEELKKDGYRPNKNGDPFATKLLPVEDIHFSNLSGKSSGEAQLYTLLAIGLLIILIACFNFININLANAFTRGKEIAVRKCLGAAKEKLFGQFWSESFLVCLIAFVLSLALVNIVTSTLNSAAGLGMPLGKMKWEPGFLGLCLGLLLFVSLIAGGYPSFVMTKFKVTETLKGKLRLNRNSLLRNSLIVLQFTIACIMISCTMIIYKQFKHLQQAPLGINKDYIISIPFKNAATAKENISKLRSRLASNPAILSITGSSINVGVGKDKSESKMTSGFEYKGKNVSVNIAAADYGYLKTFGLKAIEGRDFEKSSTNDSAYNVLLSESAAKQFEEKNIVGQQVITDSSMPRWNIVGIFPDFHLYSLHEKIEPLALVLSGKEQVRYCFIKTNAQNALAAMDAVKTEMAELEPGREFSGSFLDENINNWYRQERSMSVLFSVAAVVAILLSCMGLLAMVLLIIQQRVKEIGVRKVLGASVQNISFLISKEFLKLVILAVVVAIPITWIIMSRWLQGFPYRIEIKWWMFGLMALAAILMALMTIGINTVKAAMQNPVKNLRTE
ncbi:MAG: ABC transporter permease [Ferruginibacter sp.]